MVCLSKPTKIMRTSVLVSVSRVTQFMNRSLPSFFGRLVSVGVLTMAFAAQQVSGQILDNGVEPANLGKGDWIYFLSTATNKLGGNVPAVTNVASLMSYEKSKGMSFIVVKAGDGATIFPSSGSPQFTTSLVNAAHTAGLKIFGYDRSWGTNIAGEITICTNAFNMGADGFVIDAEGEWESSNLPNNTTAATQLCQGIKNAFPTRFLAHAPFPLISLHSTFPYKQFGLYCDAVMPQDYWNDIGVTPTQMVSDMDTEWRNWQNSLTGNFTNAIKPIAPIGQASSPATGAEITTFVNALKSDANPATKGGYRGVSFWRADLHTTDMWNGIASSSIGGAQTNAPIISSVASDNLTDTSVSISWFTDVSSDSAVEYGPTTAYGNSVTNATMTFSHSVSLTGLTASTLYHYRVKSKNGSGLQSISGDFTFTTFALGDIIIDNTGATVVGAWSTGTSSTDKYGADYRYKSQGTGAAYLQYTPTINITGSYDVYEWHPVGANRTVSAPYVVNFNGGSQTISVNQEVSGGQWNLIGNFNFAVGTTGNIQITDGFADAGQLVMADGIKLHYMSPPAAPSGLVATTISASQINLTWTDNSPDESNFVVARSTTAGGPYTDIATLAANATTYSNTGLAANTTYYYVVRAISANGVSPNSNQGSATTLQVAPAAPSGLAATAASSTQINLTWVDNSSIENNFIVARSSTSGGPYTDIATLGANVTANSDTGLSASTTYYYVVRASNAAGSSANSAQASATTLTPVPAAPSSLTATAIKATRIDLAWTDNSNNENNFIVARSATAGGPYTDIATLAANTTGYIDNGLTASTAYYYVVRASNATGSSPTSNEDGIATPESNLLIDDPSALLAGSWNIGSSAADKYGADYLFKAQGTGAAYSQYSPWISTAGVYQVYEWHAQGANRTVGAPHIITYNGGSQTVNVNQQLNGGQWNLLGTFNFAVGNSGNVKITDGFADVGQVVIADAIQVVYLPPPAAPSALTATTISSSQINLAWTDNATNETNLIVSRSTTSGGPYTDIATLAAGSTSYNNTGLSANTAYYYVVRATNAGGTSANSNQASATTLPLPPTAPSALAATTLSTTQIKLTWTDNSANESNFIVARSTTTGGPYTDIATLAANTAVYTNSGLTANTTYYYVVRATNTGGSSANSAQASATTPSGVADIIIDNPAATVTGTWSTGTSSTDKFGTDYRFKGQGTGTAFLKYTPTITTAGHYQVYEWHSVGGNRTVGAPHVITFNGGSQIINVNQQVSGGQWNLLGNFLFAAGSTGNVKITDGFTDATQVAMADGIKLVYVGP
ncbi:MAG: Fibronectin type domain protein [Pedosphaera sp.]|nr:Fibronectin type domain protein [Pedosphaera sp.]